MSTSNTFWMRCPAGVLVPREAGPATPKWVKFYNWPRDAAGNPEKDRPDFPQPKDIPEVIVEVPRDHHHATLVIKGPCTETKAPKAPKKGKE